MAIDEAFFISRRGVRMVLYAGVLQEAHERGIRSIETELLQVPNEDNGQTAIVKATVEMLASVELQNGDHEGRGPRFSGLGDASPASTSSQMVPHLLRLAETRAKARALKDAVNIGVVSMEEMGGDEDSAQASQTPSPNQRTGQGSAGAQAANTGGEKTRGGASRKAAGKLWHLAKNAEYGVEGFEKTFGSIQQMDAKTVSEHIDRLTKEGA